jgi:transcriptional regulator with XRE-family HTH domain
MSVPSSHTERHCRACGVKLSRYNPDPLCWSCQEGKQATVTNGSASSFPSFAPSSRSAFTLRSILDAARRTRPVQLSDVGQVLKHYRSIHHLTQRDLALLLGLDQSYISKLENGQGLRDIATLKHIANSLSIPGQWLGLTTDDSSSMCSSELVEVAPSVIRLSQTVREAGRADAAVNELWPLILRLEAQTTQDNDNPRLLLMLASAQATLGVILGDLLPEENLWMSVHFFKRAVTIVDEHDDALLKAEVYRGCGNELRKHKQYAEAVSYLEQALSLSADGITKGLAAALLARTFGEMGDWENFRNGMRTALYFQDKVASFTPTFNPVMLQEVRLRGLLNAQHVNEIPLLLKQNTTHSLSVSIAPQWQVISHLTKAEALFHVGKLDDGLDNLKTALIGAELCKLPHQVQRAIRAVRVVESYSPAKTIGDEAKLLLAKLSQQSLQLPSPQ